MKCYSYVRFSSKEQAKGRSYERQVEAAKKFAEQQGWDLDENLCMYDLGLSGFHAEHKSKGELGIFLKAISEKKIETPSALIVENLDRLSREEITDALTQFLEIVKSGITIVTLMDQQIYTRESLSNNYTQLIISISVMVRGYEESRTKQIRRSDVWDNVKKQARNGKKFKGRCVAWLKLNKETGEFEEIPEHVKTVRKIYELYLEGHGLVGICKFLNNEHTKTFHKKTEGWNFTSVRRILSTRSVIGDIQFTKTTSFEDGKRIMIDDGEPVSGYYPSVIDEDTFYAAQQIQSLRKCAYGKIGKVNNLFSRIAKCGYCGGTMEYGVRGRHKIQYLNCSRSKRNCCEINKYISLRYADLEEAFMDNCAKLNLEDIIPDQNIENIKLIEGVKLQLNTTATKIIESEKKVKKFTKAIESSASDDTVEYFVHLINEAREYQKELKTQKIQLEKYLADLEQNHDKTAKSLNDIKMLKDKLSSVDDNERLNIRRKLQRHILQIVDKILVFPGGKALKMLLENQDGASLQYVKSLNSKSIIKTFRQVEIYFRAGGVLSLTHDHRSGGLKFSGEKTKEGLFSKKTYDYLLENPYITEELLDPIKNQFSDEE